MMHGKYVFAFLDPRFNYLTRIIAVKPVWYIFSNWICSKMDQGTITLCFVGIEIFETYI